MAASFSVALGRKGFTPGDVRVVPGTAVRWTNGLSAPCRFEVLTSTGAHRSGDVQAGSSYTFLFEEECVAKCQSVDLAGGGDGTAAHAHTITVMFGAPGGGRGARGARGARGEASPTPVEVRYPSHSQRDYYPPTPTREVREGRGVRGARGARGSTAATPTTTADVGYPSHAQRDYYPPTTAAIHGDSGEETEYYGHDDHGRAHEGGTHEDDGGGRDVVGGGWDAMRLRPRVDSWTDDSQCTASSSSFDNDNDDEDDGNDDDDNGNDNCTSLRPCICSL